MWICLNDAFLSIVDEKAAATRRTNTAPELNDILLVRARVKGDLERVFGPEVRVQRTPDRDYMYRTYVTRQELAHALMTEVLGIDYGNFKDSVLEDDRHGAYAAVWGIMYRFQELRQGARRPRGMRELF